MAGARLFDDAAAEVNGAWITDATELATSCSAASTKTCLCAAKALVVEEGVFASAAVDCACALAPAYELAGAAGVAATD